MKTYIINLPKDVKRRAFQEEQLQSLKLPYEIIPATTVQEVVKQDYHLHRDDWQRPLRDVEIACFYSHYHLWQKVSEQHEPVLILEDDALLSQKLPIFLKNAASLKGIDFINLESVGRKKIISSKPMEIKRCDTKLFRLYLDRNGAGGYILFPTGAKKLLDFAAYGIGLADAHIRSCPNLIAYQASPILVIQLDQCQNVGLTPPLEVVSNITYQNKPTLPWTKMLQFKKRRIAEQIRQGIKHLKILAGAKKKEIPINKKEFKL